MIGILGAGGFVGRHLVSALAPINTLDGVDVLNLQAGVFDGIDTLIYLVVGDNEVIVRGLENTLEKALKAKVKKVIYLSSIIVLKSKPDFWYYNAKIEAEKLVHKFRERGMNIIMLRPGYVYGEGGKTFTRDYFKEIDRGFYPPQNGSGIFNGVYVKNLCEVIIKAIAVPIKNEDFNITDGFKVTFKDLFDSYIGILGKEIKPKRFIIVRKSLFSRLSARVLKLIFSDRIVMWHEDYDWYMNTEHLSMEKAERLLGYSPAYSFKEAMGNIETRYKNIY